MKKFILLLTIIILFLLGIVLTACGKTVVKNYVTFFYNYSGKGEYFSIQYKEGEKIAPPSKPTRDGYAFDSWYTNRNCKSENKFIFTENVMPNQDLQLYAGWKKLYNVKFHLNDPNVQASSDNDFDLLSISQVVENGIVSQPNDPQLPDVSLKFSGWYSDRSAKTKKWNFTDDIVTSNLDLYAYWENSQALLYYNVIFYLNYEGHETAVHNTFLVRPGDNLGKYRDKIYNPTRTDVKNVKFTGWYFDAQCSVDQKCTDIDKYVVNSDTVFFAGWQKLDPTTTFNVCFYWNFKGHETDEYATKSVEVGKPIGDVKTPVREEADFTNWYTEPACQNIWNLKYSLVTQSVSLYAGWREKTYKVRFFLDNTSGTPINEVEFEANTIIKSENVKTPTKKGYKFKYWYYVNNLNKKVIWNLDKDKVTSNIDLYGDWDVVKTNAIENYNYETNNYYNNFAINDNLIDEEYALEEENLI